jgi:hypothetical protein
VTRFFIAEFGAGETAVVVDLASGRVFRVNQTGVIVTRALERGGVEEARAELVARFGISAEQALADVNAVSAQLAASEAPREPADRLRLHAERDGYVISCDGRPQVWFDAARIVRAAGAEPRAIGWAAPHLIALHDRIVLHAGAVQHAQSGAVLALIGPSRAGKTTTARAFGRVVSEDLLPLDAEDRALVGAEAALERAIAAHRGEDVAPILAAGARGTPSPLTRILIVDEARRAGSEIVTTALAPADAMTALLGNAFAEVPDARVWRNAAALSARLAASGRVHAATMPEGADALPAAAARYSRISSW